MRRSRFRRERLVLVVDIQANPYGILAARPPRRVQRPPYGIRRMRSHRGAATLTGALKRSRSARRGREALAEARETNRRRSRGAKALANLNDSRDPKAD